jgi:biopolymer transport protein TolQ
MPGMTINALYSTAVESVIPQQIVSQDAVDLILNSSFAAKLVLAVLLLLSLVSWTIILEKLRQFRRLRRESNHFMQLFHKRKGVREILSASKRYPNNPFAAVFKEAYWLFNQQDGRYAALPAGSESEPGRERARQNHQSNDLVRLFDSVASREVLSLEKSLIFLATTGSISPFLGLLGTVWGVMSAFLSIGFTGSADLSVVAPGIAEALVTTIAGLAAAIPAVVSYNFFVSKLKRLSTELDIFYSNLIEAFARRESSEAR